jgi:hypothetical protein
VRQFTHVSGFKVDSVSDSVGVRVFRGRVDRVAPLRVAPLIDRAPQIHTEDRRMGKALSCLNRYSTAPAAHVEHARHLAVIERRKDTVPYGEVSDERRVQKK